MVEDFFIAESKYAEPERLEFLLAVGIVDRLRIMNASVYLNNQVKLSAIEINEEAADRMLASQLQAG